jgi:hypothetical protein
MMITSITRRRFSQTIACGVAWPHCGASGAEATSAPPDSLANEIGVTTSSLSGHLVAKPVGGQFSLLDLPRVMRDELDVRIIDLNTSSLASMDGRYLDQCRTAAEKAGCVFTNLKMNQRNVDMNSKEKAVRRNAMNIYKASIDAASRLGCRWVRPLPTASRPNMQLHVASYQELAEYGAVRGIRMLVENYGWMESDPSSIVKLTVAIGHQAAACPDTGNWNNNTTRYTGLAKTFPTAVTCDFKARVLGPEGEHKQYDLRRCFDIGWRAGFRGPWCLEHGNRDRSKLFQELTTLRDMLREWTSVSSK